MSLYLDTVRPKMIMTYYASAPLLASLFATAIFFHYMSLLTTYILLVILKYNTFCLLAEITLKLGLQSTEAYFPYIAYMRFLFFIIM